MASPSSYTADLAYLAHQRGVHAAKIQPPTVERGNADSMLPA